jgi:hypothetical protein
VRPDEPHGVKILYSSAVKIVIHRKEAQPRSTKERDLIAQIEAEHSGGDTIQIGIGHGTARGSFWTSSSSVTPPKKRRESMTENPFSRKILRK